ncbi:MAG: hypothetical protein ACI84D_003012 [Thalassolituus oleivorans]|jgi:hypothetical protein
MASWLAFALAVCSAIRAPLPRRVHLTGSAVRMWRYQYLAPMRHLILISLVSLVFACGCKGDQTPAAIRSPDSPRLLGAPRIVIGDSDTLPGHLLHRVGGGALLADGNLAISVSGSHEVRWFDQQGEFLFASGSQGSGPGEFGQFSSMRLWALSDGSVIVDDSPSRRYHKFAADGGLVWTRTVSLPLRLDGSVWLEGVFADTGALIGVSVAGHLAGNPGDLIRSEFRVFSLSPDGSFSHMWPSLQSRTRIVNEANGVTHYPFLPFSAQELVTGGPSGEMFLLRQGDRLTRIDSLGMEFPVSGWNPTRQRITPDMIVGQRDVTLNSVSARRRPLYESLYADDLPLPEYLPVGSALLWAAPGRLYVEHYRAYGDSSAVRVDVIDVDVGLVATLEVPNLTRILDVSATHLLGLRTESGVEQVVLFDL